MNEQNNNTENQQQQPAQQTPYQQGAYQQQPPYQQPIYQQTVVVQQAPQPTAMPASEGEKKALFSTAGSIWMLIACIISTINLITGLVGNILSLSIFGGIVDFILDLIMVIGLWLVFANGRKKNLSTTGVSMIKVTYIISFVFLVLGFAGNLIIWILTLNIISLVFGILTFVFDCIVFASVKKTLNMAKTINQNRSAVNMKAGVFAGVVMIISAAFTLIGEIISYFVIQAIKEALEGTSMAFLSFLLGGSGIITIVVAVIAFIVDISIAIVLLQFHKRIKEVNG